MRLLQILTAIFLCSARPLRAALQRAPVLHLPQGSGVVAAA
jgi:hypothetical protein